MSDFYTVLGIDPTASEAEVRTAYERLLAKVHPDHGGTAELFRQVRLAGSTLTDPDRRAAYDATRAAPAASAQPETEPRPGPEPEPQQAEAPSEPRPTDEVVAEADTNGGSADADAEVGASAESTARRHRRPAVVLTALLVIAAVAAGGTSVRAWTGRQQEQARSQATAAAGKAAELVLSYDYRSLDKDFDAARTTLTPEFAADFDQTTKVVAEQARKTKATVKAEVREVGVRDGDADRVTLLVFVNQTTTSTITQGKPRVDLNRARFTMVRNGDRWLVQEIAGL